MRKWFNFTVSCEFILFEISGIWSKRFVLKKYKPFQTILHVWCGVVNAHYIEK
jgi:hypothetical protein